MYDRTPAAMARTITIPSLQVHDLMAGKETPTLLIELSSPSLCTLCFTVCIDLFVVPVVRCNRWFSIEGSRHYGTVNIVGIVWMNRIARIRVNIITAHTERWTQRFSFLLMCGTQPLCLRVWIYMFSFYSFDGYRVDMLSRYIKPYLGAFVNRKIDTKTLINIGLQPTTSITTVCFSVVCYLLSSY